MANRHRQDGSRHRRRSTSLSQTRRSQTFRISFPCSSRSSRQAEKLIIIAEDIEGEALTTILVNKLRGTFTCVGVKAPGFGDRRKEMLQDIAILTGGKVITSELGLELKDTTDCSSSAAHARSRSHKENTIIVDGAGDKDAIKSRVNQIRTQIENTASDYRQREASGAPCKACRRRSGHQGRRSYRDRDEGEEAPHRGCSRSNQGSC